MRKEKKIKENEEILSPKSPHKNAKKNVKFEEEELRRMSHPQPIRANIHNKFKLKRQSVLSQNEKPRRKNGSKFQNISPQKKSANQDEENFISFEEVEEEENIITKSKIFVELVLENSFFISFMSIMTIYSLFGNSIKAFVDPDKDIVFNTLSTLTLSFFLIEIILSCFANNEYIWTFFFWLDVISTATLCLEIDWIFDPLIGLMMDDK